MNKQYLLNMKAASISFILVWALNEVILVNITKEILPQTWWVVKFMASLGLYALVYQYLYNLLQSKFAMKASREGKIIGEWYQIFQINNYEEINKNDHIRFGTASINLNDNSLEISAKSNKSSDKSSNSHWYSDQVSVRGQKLWLIFSSSGPGRGATLGTMEIHFQGDNPVSMSGVFHDASPSKHYGNMEFYRSKNDFDNRLTELMQV